LKFDHIFFTGSTRVGQIVYEAASKNLVPVTLELGGKSPTIVTESANIKVAARRIAFGKFINLGQTCIAPDYIYAHESIYDQLLEELKDVIEKMYSNIDQLGTIINQRHFNRLNSLIDTKKVYLGNNIDENRLFISPTILKDNNWEDLVMQEEIFGPILPVLKYSDLNQVISLLKEKEKPLALYLFTNDKQIKNKILSSLSFGGGAINDTIMHVSNPNLPFGGVGLSGMGRYHGQSSFLLFSNQKGYIDRKVFFDPPIAYPPYSSSKEKLIRKLLK
jgi:aldehyde dehydrogenase (NAD+)